MEDKSEHKKHEGKKIYMEHEQHKRSKHTEVTAWTLGVIAVVLAILLIVSITTKGFVGSGSSATSTTLKPLSADDVKAKTIKYLNDLLPGQTVSVDSVKDEGDLYSIKLSIQGRTYDSFARKDGSFLFPSGIDMSKPAPAQDASGQPAAQPTETPKTDKPKVELFVMSHCPFGTQAEKGILPAVRALGDKVDFQIKFVYYAMHGENEVKEELRQYCINKEEPDKYLKYVACFLNSTDSGSPSWGDKCMAQVGIDKTKIDACTPVADKQFDVMKNFNDQSSWLSGRFPLINFNKEDNTKYSVGGSPTLVINGVQSNAGRDSASYLSAICNAMTTKSAECSTTLSSTQPGPGFGYDSVGSAQAAGCGV